MKAARGTFTAALLAGASLLVLAGCATGNPDCPADARDLPLQSLYGRWEARFAGLPAVAVVQLGKHPDYAGVRGTITRNAGNAGNAGNARNAGNAGSAKATVAQLAGDVDDEGALSIDESQDGHAISGVWSGKLQARSCGREFRGTWRNAADDSVHPFVLGKKADPNAAAAAAPTAAPTATPTAAPTVTTGAQEGKQ
jgi:hypothetical protein